MKTDNQLETLEKLTHDIEFTQIELEVVEGLRQGNEALKKVNQAINIEDIERILDETREAKEKQDVRLGIPNKYGLISYLILGNLKFA